MQTNRFQALWLCGLLFATLPASAFQTRADDANAQASDCSAAAIEKAASAHVTPQLTGCNIKDVTGPLLRYFRIVPGLRESAGRQSTGTITAQKPAAGEALRAGGSLALSVSTGLPARDTASSSSSESAKPDPNPNQPNAAQPNTSQSASSAPKVDPVVMPPVVPDIPPDPKTETASSAAVFEIPVVVPETPVSAEAISASAGPEAPFLKQTIRGFPLWALILAIGVAILAALSFGLRKPKRISGQGLVPNVTCRLKFGPGRLSVKGRLVSGERQIP